MLLHFPSDLILINAKPFSLKRLVSRLLSEYQPFAVNHHSFIINDVSDDFFVHGNKEDVDMIISSLLKSVVSRSRNGCIRVTARRYHDIIVIRLKDSCSISLPDYFDLKNLNVLAEKLGGCVLENNKRSKNAVITFRFQCLAKAA